MGRRAIRAVWLPTHGCGPTDLDLGASSIPALAADNGFALYAMEPVAPTLEDIFLQAVASGSARHAHQAKPGDNEVPS